MPTTKPGPGVEPHRIESFDRVGLTFDVIDRGPLDGDVVVLLHGFPQRATCWAPVTARLNDSGLRSLALDQRGYSPRARPRRRRDYRLDELVADVCALLDTLPGDVHLVGHDWGSTVAWVVAARRPDVRSLTSISVPHPAAYLRSVLSLGQLAKSWYLGFFQLPRLPELAAQRGRMAAMLTQTGMTEAEVTAYRRDVLDDGALRGGLGWYRAIPLAFGGARRLWMERVKVPVTHVWSDGDTALSRGSAELAHRWAAGEFELRVLEGLSHWLPEQAPDLLSEIILDRVRRSG